MDDTFDPDRYFEHMLKHALPWDDVGPTTPTTRWQEWWQALPVSDDLSSLARSSGWVLTSEQLRGVGWSWNDIRRELRRGTLWSPGWGAATPVQVVDQNRLLQERRVHALRATARSRRRPDDVIEGRSAAVLHGLPVRRLPELPELASAHASGWRQAAHARAMRLGVTHVESWFGVPVTTVARTLVDLGRRNADDAIMAADAALRAGLTSPAGIQHALDAGMGWPGIRRAREVLALASPLAESPLESVTRLRLHDDGFPPPTLQFVIGAYRVDLCWPELRLILECDGLDKYADDALRDEKRRERSLRGTDRRWTIDRVTWADVDADWPATSAGLRVHFPSDFVTTAPSP